MRVTQGIKDSAGNSRAADLVGTFRTAGGENVCPPQVDQVANLALTNWSISIVPGPADRVAPGGKSHARLGHLSQGRSDFLPMHTLTRNGIMGSCSFAAATLRWSSEKRATLATAEGMAVDGTQTVCRIPPLLSCPLRGFGDLGSPR